MNEQQSRILITLLALLIASSSPNLIADEKPVPPPRLLDVLVVAPHSDDEAIGCTGVRQ